MLDSQKEMPAPKPCVLSEAEGYKIYGILVDLKPEWDNFLEKAVDNLKFIFHVNIEKGITVNENVFLITMLFF